MYVDAVLDSSGNRIHVVERTTNGARVYKEYPAEYVMYTPDPHGRYKDLNQKPLRKHVFSSKEEYTKHTMMLRRSGKNNMVEHDVNPVFRCLADNYLNEIAPKLNTAFFDIETAFEASVYSDDFMIKARHIKTPDTVLDINVAQLAQLPIGDYEVLYNKHWYPASGCEYFTPGRGYAPTDDPFNEITAISVYLQWIDRLVCFAIKPATLTKEQATAICNKFDDTFLFDTEKEMLGAFLDLIEDADVLSGWNSEGYDIPYTTNRLIKVLGKESIRRLCLWNMQPKKRKFERFGAEMTTYDLIGRIHLDYMQLYIKYTYHEMHSYSLDAIAEYELGEKKVEYEGNLDQLFKNDFELFIKYSRQDTALLGRLDEKLQFLDLTNVIAHDNTVLLQTTMGAVAVTDMAIINEAHRLGLQVPSKVHDRENTQAAGAYVAYPKKGMHKYIGSVDLNSLYPSVLRALNASPENIVGQVRQTATLARIEEAMRDVIIGPNKKKKGKSFAEAWEGLFGSDEYTWIMEKRSDKVVHIDWEADGSATEMSAAQAYELVFNSGQPWILSANGTIFRNDRPGVIPGLLERWYSERKLLQKKAKQWKALKSGIAIPERLLDGK